MKIFVNKINQNKENKYQSNNKVISYQQNSTKKKYYTSIIHSYNRLNKNVEEPLNIYKSINILEKQSFDSLNESDIINANNNYYENKIENHNDISYDNNYFNNYKYYKPTFYIHNSLPMTQKHQNTEKIDNYEYNSSMVIKNEYIKYNPNYFNRGKNNNSTKIYKNKVNTINDNAVPKRTIYKVNSKYGELSRTNIINKNNNNVLSKYFNSFNNNFLNYLAQSNYNEDSFTNNEGTNDENDNYQLNKLTRYDLRKKKSLKDGQTFFIQKAKNSKNYKFLEIKRPKNKKPKLIKKNEINLEIKEDKDKEKKPDYNITESINISQNDNDEMINNHSFVLIKSPPSLKMKKIKMKIK